ncbi:hypothetical protein SBRY_80084 [Actinacidiphila bryophytorum]|uniref:Uncharacterized protein n=1 Tax=Actinacidiphila bryophytorum TaxID=1436133 RepID=A0A9W4MKV5_9ACTN|nr:hypothetical protein SBRY_80084 [Actinacidiphila bryophytorum]
MREPGLRERLRPYPRSGPQGTGAAESSAPGAAAPPGAVAGGGAGDGAARRAGRRLGGGVRAGEGAPGRRGRAAADHRPGALHAGGVAALRRRLRRGALHRGGRLRRARHCGSRPDGRGDHPCGPEPAGAPAVRGPRAAGGAAGACGGGAGGRGRAAAADDTRASDARGGGGRPRRREHPAGPFHELGEPAGPVRGRGAGGRGGRAALRGDAAGGGGQRRARRGGGRAAGAAAAARGGGGAPVGAAAQPATAGAGRAAGRGDHDRAGLPAVRAGHGAAQAGPGAGAGRGRRGGGGGVGAGAGGAGRPAGGAAPADGPGPGGAAGRRGGDGLPVRAGGGGRCAGHHGVRRLARLPGQERHLNPRVRTAGTYTVPHHRPTGRGHRPHAPPHDTHRRRAHRRPGGHRAVRLLLGQQVRRREVRYVVACRRGRYGHGGGRRCEQRAGEYVSGALEGARQGGGPPGLHRRRVGQRRLHRRGELRDQGRQADRRDDARRAGQEADLPVLHRDDRGQPDAGGAVQHPGRQGVFGPGLEVRGCDREQERQPVDRQGAGPADRPGLRRHGRCDHPGRVADLHPSDLIGARLT